MPNVLTARGKRDEGLVLISRHCPHPEVLMSRKCTHESRGDEAVVDTAQTAKQRRRIELVLLGYAGCLDGAYLQQDMC